MKIKLLALCAVTGLCASLQAADTSDVSLAIYYSFETSPPPRLFAAVQSELTRILAPANLHVTWRPIDNRSGTDEAFREIVVLRFRGACLFDENSAADVGPDAAGYPLAETELVDGHILPFGEVQCDPLRHYIAPLETKRDLDHENTALGKAIARVGAHEIYHMLTGSVTHARTGIARAEHSRADLTAGSFSFAKPETDWLRSWAQRQTIEHVVATKQQAPVAVAAVDNDPVPDGGAGAIISLDSAK